MTLEDLIKRVWDMCDANGIQRPGPDAIETIKETVLPKLADTVAASPDRRYRAYTQSELSIAMTAGTALLAPQGTMMIEYVLRVTHPVQGVLSHAKDVTYLSLEKSPMGGAWYAIEQDKLFGRLDDGVLFPDDATIVILTNVSLTLATLHVQLEDELITLIYGRIGGQPPAPVGSGSV